MNERYNGWTNFQTWCVNAWLCVYDGRYWREQAEEWYATRTNDGVHFGHREIQGLASQIRARVRTLMRDHEVSLFNDLLEATLEHVNWREIAVEFLSNLVPDGDTTAILDDN